MEVGAGMGPPDCAEVSRDDVRLRRSSTSYVRWPALFAASLMDIAGRLGATLPGTALAGGAVCAEQFDDLLIAIGYCNAQGGASSAFKVAICTGLKKRLHDVRAVSRYGQH